MPGIAGAGPWHFFHAIAYLLVGSQFDSEAIGQASPGSAGKAHRCITQQAIFEGKAE
jgi:hypothetical protein